jgi:hypothetical protein
VGPGCASASKTPTASSWSTESCYSLDGDSLTSDSLTSDRDYYFDMATNPFQYGTPVEGANFTGRESELDALVSRMRNGINVVLLSPRRYGKTSLLLRAEARLARSRPVPAVVRANVLRSRDLATLVSQLTTAVYGLRGARWHRARQGVPEFLHRLGLRPTVTINDQGQPVFGFEPSMTAPDADTILGDLYELLDEQADQRPAVLVLDEFQAITDHGAHLPRLLKALADQHPRVGLVMAGSKQHLMERLVSVENAPLYGMAQKLALGPIPDEIMTRFLASRAKAGGKAMNEETAHRVLALSGPVPNDIQRLAYEAYEAADAEIDAVAVGAGLDRAVAHEAATYAELYESRSPGQRRVLAALAEGNVHPVFSASFARAVGLAGSNSVKKVVDALIADELLGRRPAALEITDPFLAAWLRQAP